LIDILSSSTEFENLPIRNYEESILYNLYIHSDLKIENPKFTEPQTKVFLLLQSHFGRKELSNNFDLVQDKNFILKKSINLIYSMVDVISSNGWLNPVISAMELSQMVIQSLWNTDSPLLQLPFFNKELVEKFKKEGVNKIYDIIEMDDNIRGKLLENFTEEQNEELTIFLNRYPLLDVEFGILNQDNILSGKKIYNKKVKMFNCH
jgi:pre-mRNA-splicing helicase BRR2